MFEKLKFKTHKLSMSYPVPININIFWNFGVLAFLFLTFQIISGIFLAMHYIPHTEYAFESTEHIMRDVNYGWFLRYFHSNGASFFFLVVYIHIARGIFYSSYMYPRAGVWFLGVIIFFIMILTAFIGYVLPWGQMSYWAATVITNLASAFPFIGDDIVIWLWGGFSVGAPTLNRFYSLHYIFPIIIIFCVMFHIILLHLTLSNNPLGTQPDVDEVSFSPFYVLKDINFGVWFLGIFGVFAHFLPNILAHPDNYVMANALVTPTHIVPEWYFLLFYAILRSVPNKLLGVVLLFCSILILFLLPFIVSYEIRSSNYKFLLRYACYMFFGNCVILAWIGGKEIMTPYYEIGQICTIFYFLFFIVILPFLHRKV